MSKGNDGFHKGGFRLYQPDKGAGKDFPQTKAEERIEKEKGKEGTYPQSGFSASETPNEEGESDDWSASHQTDDSWTPDAGWFCTRTYTAWMVATPLNLANHPTHVVLDLGCARSNRSRAAIERFKKHAWYYGITTEFCRCNTSIVFANSETETCKVAAVDNFDLSGLSEAASRIEMQFPGMTQINKSTSMKMMDDEYYEEDVDRHTGDCNDGLDETAFTVGIPTDDSELLEQLDGNLENADPSASQVYASASRSFHEARELLSRVKSAGLAQPSTDRTPAKSRGKSKKGNSWWTTARSSSSS